MNDAPKKYDANLRHHVTEAFSRHVIEPGRQPVTDHRGPWRMHRAGEGEGGFYWAEVARLAGARLIVHGDIAPVLFQSSTYHPTELVEWAATSDLEYLAGKVIAGAQYTTDDTVAIADLTEWRTHVKPANRQLIDSAMRALRKGTDLGDVKRVLLGSMDCLDWLSGVGKVIDASVYYAHGALRRLAALLKGDG